MTPYMATCIVTQIEPYLCLCDPYYGENDLQLPLLFDTIKISVLVKLNSFSKYNHSDIITK